MRRKFREEAEEANQLVSRAELKTQLDVAMLMEALEWIRETPERRNFLQRDENSRAARVGSSSGITPVTLPLAVIQDAPEGRSASDQSMLDEHRRMVIRWEYMRTISVDDRLEFKRVIREEHPGASVQEVKEDIAPYGYSAEGSCKGEALF